MARKLCLVVTVSLVWAVLACAPKAVPRPMPTTPPPDAAPVAQAPALRPEEAAWARVVEAAKKEGQVTVYSFYFVADIGRSVAQAFRDKYGIRVEVLPAAGRQIVEKVKVERQINKPIADIVNCGTSSATELSLAGLGESVWWELPSLRDKGVFAVDPVYSPEADVLLMSLNLIGTLINTQRVTSQQEPRSYWDFLEPTWKGRLLATDPRAGSGGLFTTLTTLRHYKVMGDDYWKRLAPQLKLFGGSTQELYLLIGRGEYDVGLGGTDTSVAHVIGEGAPLKMLALEEGTPAQGGAIMAVKGAPHPNASRLFMDWVFSFEGQAVYSKVASTTPLRYDVSSSLPPAARIQPKRLFSYTWEVAEAANKFMKAGGMEEIFGKR